MRIRNEASHLQIKLRIIGREREREREREEEEEEEGKLVGNLPHPNGEAFGPHQVHNCGEMGKRRTLKTMFFCNKWSS